MIFRVAADVTLLVHLVFILFVIGGALFLLRYPRIVWPHVPAAIWGIWVELSGKVCPLTTLENVLREWAGQSGYAESFVEHYIVPVIYPEGLTRDIQLLLATIVLFINLGLYIFWLLRCRKSRIDR